MYNEVDGTTPTSNRPLRGGKATVFEGGVIVPLGWWTLRTACRQMQQWRSDFP